MDFFQLHRCTWKTSGSNLVRNSPFVPTSNLQYLVVMYEKISIIMLKLLVLGVIFYLAAKLSTVAITHLRSTRSYRFDFLFHLINVYFHLFTPFVCAN